MAKVWVRGTCERKLCERDTWYLKGSEERWMVGVALTDVSGKKEMANVDEREGEA